MARPERRDADYFPFYAKDGRTLRLLQHRHGLAGIGFFTNLMRLLTQTQDHHLVVNTELEEAYVFSVLGCDPEEGLPMLETMVLTGKIHKELWERSRVIVCPDLLDSLTDAYAKRTNDIVSIEQLEADYLTEEYSGFRGQKPTYNGVSGVRNPTENGSGVVSGVNNPQRKGKERKGKDTSPSQSHDSEAEDDDEVPFDEPKPLSPMKDDLATEYQNAFAEEVPPKAWKSVAQERAQLKKLAKLTRGLAETSGYGESELVNIVLEAYRQMRKYAKADFWQTAPFTPSALVARWDPVVEQIRQKHDSAQAIARGMSDDDDDLPF